MPCVFSRCSNKGGYAGNRNCTSWLRLVVFSNPHAQLPRSDTYFFASFSLKRKQICARVPSVLSSFLKTFRCFDMFAEHVTGG